MKKKIDGLPDYNEVLDYENLFDILKALKILKEGGIIEGKIGNLDKKDLYNFEKWYLSYNMLYTYKGKKRKLSQKEIKKFKEIEDAKGDTDIMNLVEISIGRLLEKYFFDNGDNVRIRKTTMFDDVNSGLDYIVEFLDNKNDILDIVGIDLTVSNNEYNLWRKKLRERSKPYDYLYHIKKKSNKIFKFIPRLVLELDKDLVYSFTNNYFIEVLEKGDILNNNELEQNFEYAIGDLQRKKLIVRGQTFEGKIKEVIINSKERAKKIIL